jgi:hypothetical protein
LEIPMPQKVKDSFPLPIQIVENWIPIDFLRST